MISFDKRTDDGVRALATYLAQLTKEGVTYSVAQDQWAAEVTITGF